jgi:adenylate cyclase
VILAFGDHRLDIERRELRRGDDIVDLEPKAFDLLAFLVLQRDRVVTKDDLLQGVWGGRIVSESALTTRINAVRRALGDDGATQRLVRTFTRKGIRFIGEVIEVTDTASPSFGDQLGQILVATDKPSIAVLPFQSLSADPEPQFFADGIAEDVTTALSRYPSLFVISRGSCLTYRDRAVDTKEVGRELGVRYVLEGSLRKSGDRIRVAAQLIEAESSRHVWADRYDRYLADIFAVQDEIAQAVTIAIAPAIAQAERQRAIRKPPENLDAWAAYQRGLWHLSSATADGNELAEQFFRRAIDLDPNFSGAHSALAWALLTSASQFQRRSLEEVQDPAGRLVNRAVHLDGADADARACLAFWRFRSGDGQGALIEAERALAINPNLASAHHMRGAAMANLGRHSEALLPLETSIRLDPSGPYAIIPRDHLVAALYQSRHYEAAIDAARQLIRLRPDHPPSYRWLAAALGQLGRLEEAKAALDNAIAIGEASFDMYVRKRAPFWQPEPHSHMIDGLRKAGWRER